jgi:glycosyltransferase involved in cell wall biosynthesis
MSFIYKGRASNAVKVLHFIDSLAQKTGGPSRCVPGLCAALALQGEEVWLTSHHANDLPSGGNLFTISSVGASGYLACRRELERVVREFRPEVLHGHGIWRSGNHAVAVVARRHGLPLVITPHGMLQPWALRQKRWRKWLALQFYQRRDLRGAACLHATADAEVVQWRRLGFLPPVAVIPNGIEVPDDVLGMTAAAGDDAGGRGGGDRRRTVLFLSRLHPKKGLLDLVQAWSRLRPAGWRVQIAGPDEGGHRRVVETAIHAAGLDADFSFLGSLDDRQKWAAYRTADLFVLPSYGENFGLVVAEALIAGLPVITTRGAPWRELLDYRCGWWTEIGAAPLEDALRDAVALDDAARHAMGERGRQLVKEKYLWSALATRMRAVYAWLGGHRASPAWVQGG